MSTTELLRVALLVAALLATTGCIPAVVWQDRPAPEPDVADSTTPLPTCPHCGQYADWGSDQCANPDCGRRYRWVEPRELR